MVKVHVRVCQGSVAGGGSLGRVCEISEELCAVARNRAGVRARYDYMEAGGRATQEQLPSTEGAKAARGWVSPAQARYSVCLSFGLAFERCH